MNSRTKILLKKAQTHKNLNFGKHPMLRLYKKHNFASKLFLFNKEPQVKIFFESVFKKSKCDCRCLHFWHDCCFLNRVTATGAYMRHRLFGLHSSLITFWIFVRLLRLIAQNVAELFNLTSSARVRVGASCADDVSRGSLAGLEIW